MDTKQVSKLLNDFDVWVVTQIILIATVTGLLVVGIKFTVRWLGDKAPGRYRLYILPAAPLLRLLVLLTALALIFPLVIRPTTENILVILGGAGIAIGFAFKDYVSSLIAGVVTIFDRTYRTGDWVKIDDAYGEVRKVGLRAISLVTPDDTVVVIPNAKIWTTNIYNSNDGQRDLQCVAEFHLQPDHDATRVRQKLRDVALTSPFLNLRRPVTVIVSEKPWGTHYRLKAYPVEARDQFLFTSDLTVRAKAALAKLGVRPACTPMVPQEAASA
ncbi:MAG TPA: mechanosensitive ion channel protein MscS [Verrucomicrobiales bacterium]|nr:mechanosensitive ion channel protein MscS [Verrucomicrobiales bacterium]